MNDTLNVGIDVSKKTLVIKVKTPDMKRSRGGTCSNDYQGFVKIKQFFDTFKAKNIKVVLEATSTYHLDVAYFLQEQGCRVMVADGYTICNFKKVRKDRTKTDNVDAESILHFCISQEFIDWKAPSKNLLELRSISHRMDSLIKIIKAEKCRLNTLLSSKMSSKVVIEDIEYSICFNEGNVKELETKAIKLIKSEDDLNKKFELIKSINGFADRSSFKILVELLCLPQDLTIRRIVAYAGLDPRVSESGTSVHSPAKISKKGIAKIRHILYMPAISAIFSCEEIKKFYKKLVEKGKKKKQAIVAVMRKLLHAIHGMLKTGTEFKAELCFKA